jgi:hypothetical protein
MTLTTVAAALGCRAKLARERGQLGYPSSGRPGYDGMAGRAPRAARDGSVARRNSPYLLVLVLAAGSATGCAGVRHQVYTPAVVPGARGVIFAADGAGNFQATSEGLRRVVAEEGLPLRVETFEWSHGYGRMLADQLDYGHIVDEGKRLAGCVAAYRRACPAAEVYLVGHSAGSAVVLAAAEYLPSGYVDGIILLAPAVSAGYDLRPALCCARNAVDVFYSPRDRFYLGFGVAVMGTTDRCWGPAAGRVGFEPEVVCPCDAGLYRKLRQHSWDPSVQWTGNEGGHYGGYQPEFLRAYVVPLLRGL